MQQKILTDLALQFSQELEASPSSSDLEALKVKYLGKKGVIQDLMKNLKDLSAEERPAFGKVINDFKEVVAGKLEQRLELLGGQEAVLRLANETIDVTLPGRTQLRGGYHLITQVMEEMLGILTSMGFSIQYGPDVDSDYYNFEALNMGPDHPARAMQDTFYITPHMLLRTHTSNVQVRVMENTKPPIRIAAPGRAFRNEDISARSHVFFHQIETLYIDTNVTFGDLLGTLELFLQRLFHKEVEMRVRPSYFPFVEPGMEADIRCISCEGSGCAICKQTGWLEIGGAGMVHPEVLRSGGIDPEKYTGFAWGMGIDRLAMLRYGIKDIRTFWDNDLRFLSQF